MNIIILTAIIAFLSIAIMIYTFYMNYTYSDIHTISVVIGTISSLALIILLYMYQFSINTAKLVNEKCGTSYTTDDIFYNKYYLERLKEHAYCWPIRDPNTTIIVK